MWVNLGRLLMLGIWVFMLGNLIYTYPSPINIFINIAMTFMVFMHMLQVVLFKITLNKQLPQFSVWETTKLFLFGAFELLAQQKKRSSSPKQDNP